jgi:ribokinase
MVASDGVDLVIVGHFGFAEDHTPSGSARSLGGSGYACAVGAGAGRPERVGIVAKIGEDFDQAALDRLGVDRRGAVVVPGNAPHLTIVQHTATDRSFDSSLGVAAEPAIAAFPRAYCTAGHLHIATMPPAEQLQWLRTARAISRCAVSVDMFEPMAARYPDQSRELCYAADLVFMNEQEQRLLFARHPMPTRGIVLKRGANGAGYRSGGRWVQVPAPSSRLVDSTGAGEVLAGAFLSLRAMGVPAAEALHHAVRAASAKVTEFGVDGGHLRGALADIRAQVAGRATREGPPGVVRSGGTSRRHPAGRV